MGHGPAASRFFLRIMGRHRGLDGDHATEESDKLQVPVSVEVMKHATRGRGIASRVHQTPASQPIGAPGCVLGGAPGCVLGVGLGGGIGLGVGVGLGVGMGCGVGVGVGLGVGSGVGCGNGSG